MKIYNLFIPTVNNKSVSSIAYRIALDLGNMALETRGVVLSGTQLAK